MILGKNGKRDEFGPFGGVPDQFLDVCDNSQWSVHWNMLKDRLKEVLRIEH